MSFRSSLSPKTLGVTGRGFGLVELMVSISIMMLLSGVILTRHTAFSGAVLLRNQAYDVAFAIRKAQLLAVSGANAGSSSTTQQYGVYFSQTSPNNTTYITFHDLDVNGLWDPLIDEPIGVTGKLDSRFIIRDVSTPSNGAFSILTVSFRRPNFDAILKNGGGAGLARPAYIDIAQLSAAGSDKSVGAVRRVQVTSTGQISVVSF